MNLRQLRYFRALVEGKTLGAAAERLCVAPTAVSMQITQLESDLGGELFNRAVRPMTLTALGRFFLPRARSLLDQADRIEQDTRDRASGKRGRLVIGFVRSLIFSVVPRAVRAFRQKHPDVTIELIEMLSEHQTAALRSAHIDLGLSRYPTTIEVPEGLRHSLLFDDPYVAALSSQHVPAGTTSCTLAELDRLPLVSFPNNPDSGYAKHVLGVLRAAGGHPVVGHESIEIQTALGLVAAGLGYAIVGASVAEETRRDIAFVRLPQIESTTRVIAVTREDDEGPLLQDMVDFMRRP